MEVDFLLIGQGLAGSALAFRMLEEGVSFKIIDLPNENKSSRVAAGLYNPITGKKMVKTWMGDQLFPVIKPFYRRIEKLLGEEFLFETPIYRPFLSIEEQNEWMGYSSMPDMAPFCKEIHIKSIFPEINDPLGGVMLQQCGYLDINTFLDAFTHYLLQKDYLIQERFEEDKLNVSENEVHYENIKARGIVYCNGLGAAKSTYFSHLPFAPVKGEILDLEEDFTPDLIINRGVFRITLANGNVRVGSTYSWHDMDLGPTSRGKLELFEKLDKLMLADKKEVVQHRYGIRPATKDRRPFLGKHPEHESVYIFNGFGAKGVSLVPYFSQMMLDLLINANEPQKEVNIARYK